MTGRLAKLAAGPAAGAAAYLLLGGAGLAPGARSLAGIMACAVAWWITEALPLAVAGLLACSLAVVFKVAPARTVMAPYADPVIFLFVGSFWLAAAMQAQGLDKRLALRFLSLRAVNASPARLVVALGLLAASISLWVSNTATTAMLLPIALGMLQALPERSRSPRLEANLLLMLTFAASIGGLGTPVGTPPNLVGIGMLERMAGVRVDFASWCGMALPIVGASLGLLALMLGRGLQRPPDWERLGAYIKEEGAKLMPWSRGETNTAIAFGAAVLLWLFGQGAVPEGIAALLAAGLLFILPVQDGRPTLEWDRAVRIDWGTILLFGSGMSLGGLMFETRLAEDVGSALLAAFDIGSSLGVAGLASALALLTSELASNTASANVCVPVAMALSKAAEVSPVYPALAATMAASFGFLLPVSTAPNAMVYGTGKVPLRTMIRYGLLLDVFGFFAVWLGLFLVSSRQ